MPLSCPFNARSTASLIPLQYPFNAFQCLFNAPSMPLYPFSCPFNASFLVLSCAFRVVMFYIRFSGLDGDDEATNLYKSKLNESINKTFSDFNVRTILDKKFNILDWFLSNRLATVNLCVTLILSWLTCIYKWFEIIVEIEVYFIVSHNCCLNYSYSFYFKWKEY